VLAGSSLGREAIRVGAELDHRFVTPFHGGISQHFGFALCRDLGGRHAVVAQKAVRMGDVAIPALPRVEHEHAAARAAELKRCSEPGVAAANDDDIVHDGTVVAGHDAILRASAVLTRLATLTLRRRFMSTASASSSAPVTT
jgi:hypothetical protein